MVRAFDIVAVIGFGAAFLAACVALVRTSRNDLRYLSILVLTAMGIMTVVSIGHVAAAQPEGMDLSEDYAQVVFLPLVLYAMHALYARSEAERAERARRSVERLDRRLEESLQTLSEYRVSILQSLSTAVNARDHYTALHSLHVADYAAAIGARLGMHDRVPCLERAGLLHDIGKIATSDAVLLKPAGLDAGEYEEIKRHPVTGAAIIESVEFLSDVVPVVRHHHERWDGAGYPDGLAGSRIPAEARVLAVADAFDAMTSDRPYRDGLSLEEARASLIAGRGSQFDPAPLDALIALIDEGGVAVRTSDTGRGAETAAESVPPPTRERSRSRFSRR